VWTEPELLEKLFEICSVLMVKLRLSSECVFKMYCINGYNVKYVFNFSWFVTAVFPLCFKDGILEIICIY